MRMKEPRVSRGSFTFRKDVTALQRRFDQRKRKPTVAK
jgi:hypothetical protein